MTTPQDIISTARYIFNDVYDGTNTPRQSNAELLGYFNDGMKEISGLRPELFKAIGDLTCNPGQCEQTVTFADAQALDQVLCIHGGNAITPFDIPTMDAFNPGWRADTAGAAVQWSKFAGDPLRFFIYPKAPATAQVIDISYIRNPTALALTDTITEIPQAYIPALIDYIVYRAESKDDEHVNSGRATGHYQAFVAKIKGA